MPLDVVGPEVGKWIEKTRSSFGLKCANCVEKAASTLQSSRAALPKRPGQTMSPDALPSPDLIHNAIGYYEGQKRYQAVAERILRAYDQQLKDSQRPGTVAHAFLREDKMEDFHIRVDVLSQGSDLAALKV
jgi:hypothetical protein